MKYNIQHHGIGGILDQSIAIVKDNFGLLFGILLCAWIPFSLISGAIDLAISPDIPANPTLQDLQRNSQAELKNLPITLGLALIGFVTILPITNAAVIYAVAERYLGRSLSVTEAIGKGFNRLGALIWTSLLMTLAIMGGIMLCVIPGILFALWFGLAQHVVVLEGISGGPALSRSKELVRPNFGTFLVLGIIIFVIGVALGFGAELIPNLLIRKIVTIAIEAVLTLFSTAALVVFYFSCRCGVENFDLEHLAASISGDVQPESANADEANDAW